MYGITCVKCMAVFTFYIYFIHRILNVENINFICIYFYVYILYIFKINNISIFFAYTKCIFLYQCIFCICFIHKIYISENIYKIHGAILAVYNIIFTQF